MANQLIKDLRAIAEGLDGDGPQWPHIPCPSCKRGGLTLISESLIQEETAISKRNQSHPEWDPDWAHGYFSCLLRCQKPACDLVRVVGETGLYLLRSEDGYCNFFTPKFFLPHLPLIESYDLSPPLVQKRIDAAAKIIWSDPSSAANRLRSAVEALMDDQGIPRKCVRGGRPYEVNLHNRIVAFKAAKPEHAGVADLVLAVKWIGNVGSHNDSLRVPDVLEGVEILDHTLDQIYDSTKDEIKRKAADIAARKGIPASRFSGSIPF
ncbi:DUF4145 domain-containing protein [Streptomyces sp. NBC_01352]|uniref:DUF4145 domain-containing protein n=1 Tax=Streptomyces sp. NBC_01352 TaxID=2903834 RepID=UPI002E3758F9|nr:DUF4145 domain-containing protein [Streptomyces sp. NBC_01352]